MDALLFTAVPNALSPLKQTSSPRLSADRPLFTQSASSSTASSLAPLPEDRYEPVTFGANAFVENIDHMITNLQELAKDKDVGLTTALKHAREARDVIQGGPQAVNSSHVEERNAKLEQLTGAAANLLASKQVRPGPDMPDQTWKDLPLPGKLDHLIDQAGEEVGDRGWNPLGGLKGAWDSLSKACDIAENTQSQPDSQDVSEGQGVGSSSGDDGGD